MSKLKENKLSDIAEIIMGQSPKGGTCNQNHVGVPLLNGPTEFTEKYPKPIQYTTDSKRKAEDGDILFCVRGSTTGRMNWADQKYSIGRGIAAIRHKSGLEYQHFLKGVLDYKLDEILAITTGSVFPNITGDDLRELIILIPSKNEQLSIANILRSIDDKIYLLHRNGKTLEEMAETIFRKWFVEDAEDSWEEKNLKEIADHYKENSNPSKYPEKIFYHYSLPAFDEGKFPKSETGKDILSNKYKVIPNSILVSKLNPRFPRIWELFGNEIPENSICSTEFQIVKPKDISFFGFIYYFLKSSQVIQELANAAGGTSGSHQRISPDDIFNLSFLMPPVDLIKQFDVITKAFFSKTKSNNSQLRNLQTLRDSLLPKLMSGEIKILD